MNVRAIFWPGRWWLAATIAVAAFLVLVARFWHPVYGFTAFYQLDGANDDLKIAAFRELPVYVYRDTGGYDGLYYAQIAHDPTLRNPELPRAMDNLPYRARRILPAAGAWLLGAGQPRAIVLAYSVLNIAAWLALAWLLWRVLEVRDARGWLAWAGVLFSAGALSSVRLALTDLPALVLVVGALWAAERWRGRTAVATLAAAALARETSLLAVAGLIKPPWVSVKNVARALLALVPLALWLAYIRWRVGPADQGWANLAWPVAGWIEKWRATLGALGTEPDRALAWTTLLATLALTAQAVFIVTRLRLDDRWWRLGAAFVGLMLCLGTAVWEGFPGAATRVLLPLNLAVNVLAVRTRASFAWLVLANLTVFSGLLALRDVPRDPRELNAFQRGETAAIARSGEGWHGREQRGRHVWHWTAQRGTLEIETWPRDERTLVVEFESLALAPCEIVVRQGGQEIARFTATKTRERQMLHPVRIVGGHATLEFSTTTPPTRESAAPGARDLAFALFDVRVGTKKL